MHLPSINFYGLKISVFTKEELKKSIENVIQSEHSKIYYGYSLAVLSYLKKYPSYYGTTSKFDVMVTDGRFFYLLAKFFGFKLKYDVSIPRLTILAIEMANKMNLKLMMIGSTTNLNNKASINIKNQYPGIKLCSGQDGYFKKEEKENIFELVQKNKPDILLLGFPTPAKQQFALEIKDKIEGCVILPCGGMIDILAGKEKLTPLWVKKFGFASIYRHIQHPKRLPELMKIYYLTIKVFVVILYQKKIKKSNTISIPAIILNK